MIPTPLTLSSTLRPVATFSYTPTTYSDTVIPTLEINRLLRRPKLSAAKRRKVMDDSILTTPYIPVANSAVLVWIKPMFAKIWGA